MSAGWVTVPTTIWDQMVLELRRARLALQRAQDVRDLDRRRAQLASTMLLEHRDPVAVAEACGYSSADVMVDAVLAWRRAA